MITIHQVKTKAEYRQFIDVPFSLYPQGSNWVPPIKSDEMAVFHPSQNPSYKTAEAAFWLARDGKKNVGRICAIMNHAAQEKWHNKLGRFSYVNFIDNSEVSKALFDTAEEWLRSRGCDGVIGPMGFTDVDEEGLLVEGFDEPGTLPMLYAHSWYKTHIEALGYTKEIDWLEHRLEVPAEIPGKIVRAAEWARELLPGVTILEAKKRSEFKPYIAGVFDLLNATYKDLYGTSEFTTEQAEFYAEKYFSFLHPSFTKLALSPENKVIGLMIAMPTLTKAFQKARGHLFPFGFLHILKDMKNTQEVDVYLAATHPDYDNSGLIAMIAESFIQSLHDNGVKWVETSANLETNQRVLSFWKEFQHRQHKRRRVYQKKLH